MVKLTKKEEGKIKKYLSEKYIHKPWYGSEGNILKFVLILLGIVFMFGFLVPMVKGILFMFLALVDMYSLLDYNFKFLGGCFFLVVYWYIFMALIRVGVIIFNGVFKRKEEDKI